MSVVEATLLLLWNRDNVLYSIVNAPRNLRLVHRIKVNAVNAVANKVDNLAYGISDSCIHYRVIIVAVFFEHNLIFFRQNHTALSWRRMTSPNGWYPPRAYPARRSAEADLPAAKRLRRTRNASACAARIKERRKAWRSFP